MSKTDQFDMALQLKQATVQRIVQSQHAVGVLKDTFSEWFNGARVDLVINAPTTELLVSGGANIARLNTRVFYNSRDLANPNDLGQSAVADISVRAQVSLLTGNPTLITAAPQLQIDWTGTTDADIVVHTADAALTAQVKAALLRFLSLHGVNAFVLPPIGPADQRIGAVGFRFRLSGGPAILIVGMNVGPALRGTANGVTENFVQRDWALAVSRSYFLQRLRNQLDERLPVPQTVASKCTVSTFGHCLNRTTVTLTSLNADLDNGFILITGSLHIHNSGALIPDASASFEGHVTLGVESGGAITADVNSVSVDVSLFGAVIDFFTGDAFSDRILDAVASALESGTTGDATSFFQSGPLNTLASGHTSRATNLEPVLTSVQVSADAVILHGDLDTPQASHSPEPAFASIEIASPNPGSRRFLLNAHASWAPGSTVASYDWKYSDGQTESFAGTNCRFLTIHDFQMSGSGEVIDLVVGVTPGGSACLKITDVAGRSEEICPRVFVGGRLWVTVCTIYDAFPMRLRSARPSSPRPPISDELMSAATVRPPTNRLEALPLIAYPDPGTVISGPVDGNSASGYGFVIDTIAAARQALDLGPPGPPEPPDIDVLFPELGELYLPICVLTGRMPVRSATVELLLPDGNTMRSETDAHGHAGFAIRVSEGMLRPTERPGIGAGLARARFTARVMSGKERLGTRVVWLAVARERDALVRDLQRGLLDANAEFFDKLGGRAFFLSGAYRNVDPALETSIAKIALALDRLLNVVRLVKAGSAMTPLQALLALPRTAEAEVVGRRIEDLFTSVEAQIRRLPIRKPDA